MADLNHIILGASGIAQIGTVLLVLAMIPVAKERRSWLILSAAMVIILLRRLHAAMPALLGSDAALPVLDTALALIVSLLFFATMLDIRLSFKRRGKDATAARLSHQELGRAHGKLRVQVEQQHAQLSDAEARFQSFAKSASDGITTADSDGRLTSWNPGATNIFGYGEAEAIGMPFASLLPEGQRAAHAEAMARYRVFGPSKRRLEKPFEITGRAKDGREIPVELSLSCWQTDAGLCYGGILRDITTRKRVEAERDQFFRVSLDMLCLVQDGRFKRLNPAFSAVLGYTPEELCAKNAIDFVHPDDVQPTLYAVSGSGGSKAQLAVENRFQCKDGTYKWLAWKFVVVDGVTYAAARDMTEIRIAEDQITTVNESLEDLLASRVKELSQLQKRLHGVLTEIALGFWSTDSTGALTFTDGLGLPVELAHPALQAAIPQALAGGSSVVEIDDGASCFEIHVAPLRDSDGEVIGVHGATLDVTQRKLLTEALAGEDRPGRGVLTEAGVAPLSQLG